MSGRDVDGWPGEPGKWPPEHANRWAAIVPASAKADLNDAASVAGIPDMGLIAVHDPVVAIGDAREMVTAINAAGGKAHLTEVTKRTHDLSNVVFTQQALTDWLLDPSKIPPQDLTWTEPAGYDTGLEAEVPFVPGAEIPHAVRIRICSDVMEAFPPCRRRKKWPQHRCQVMSVEFNRRQTLDFFRWTSQCQGFAITADSLEHIRVATKAPDLIRVQVALRQYHHDRWKYPGQWSLAVRGIRRTNACRDWSPRSRVVDV